jgi:hypothetical protein
MHHGQHKSGWHPTPNGTPFNFFQSSHTVTQNPTSKTMSLKPIFCATHPRACSTAFERVCYSLMGESTPESPMHGLHIQPYDLSRDQSFKLTLYQVFMTCRDTLSCVHEPFGDAWYFGSERLMDRYGKEERERSGYGRCTYSDVVKEMDDEAENSVSEIGFRLRFWGENVTFLSGDLREGADDGA